MNPTDLADALQLLRSLDRNRADKPDVLNPQDPGKLTGLALIAAGARIYFDADQALERAHDYGGRGYAGGGGTEGRGKGGHTSPTEQAANLDSSMPGVTDDFTRQGDELRSTLIEARGHAIDARRRAHDLLTSAPPKSEADEARCAEYATGGCEDFAVKDRRCGACYEWMRTNPGESHVPKSVIEGRRQRRALAEATG